MANLDFDILANESEPSLFNDLNFSDFSHSVLSGNKFDTNNLSQHNPSISLNNVSTPKNLIVNCRSVSYCNVLSSAKKELVNDYKQQDLEIFVTDSNKNEIVDLNLFEKYNQALKEIESLQRENTKLKSTTPVIIRRKSSQSSMIKTCLFKNSSSAIRRAQFNSTKSSLFGTDSTCMTIDIEDGSTQTDEQMNEIVVINDKEGKCNFDNSINLSKETSRAPLLNNYSRANSTLNRIRKIFDSFVKCPQFLYKLKNAKKNKRFCNQVTPIIPRVVIISPKTSDRDSGNDSDEHPIKLNAFKSKEEILCQNMIKLADELSDKFNTFKCLMEQYANCQTKKH